MSVRKILQFGNPKLSERSIPIQATKIKNKGTQKIIKDLIETLRKSGGVGLSAPQIGESIRIIALENKPTKTSFRKQKIALTIIVNPVVIEKSEERDLDWEGCLSVKEGTVRGLVPRYKEIEVIGFDKNGKKITLNAKGYQARIIQHEIDHLDCKLFLERMRKKDFSSLSEEEMWKKHHKKNWKKPKSISSEKTT